MSGLCKKKKKLLFGQSWMRILILNWFGREKGIDAIKHYNKCEEPIRRIHKDTGDKEKDKIC